MVVRATCVPGFIVFSVLLPWNELFIVIDNTTLLSVQGLEIQYW